MIRLAYRNLFQSTFRLIISVGGVALALLLILSLDAIMAGSERQLTAYIDHSGAAIFVAQEGVKNMHMASSSLPRSLVDPISYVPGVASVSPILYLTNVIDVGEQQFLAYIIGIDQSTDLGGVWDLAAGRDDPGPAEIVIDRAVSQKAGLALGDEVEVLGSPFEIVGLARGTTSIINSVAFINMDDFFKHRGTDQVVSYLLVKIQGGQSPSMIAERIEAEFSGITALPRQAFSAEEARIIRDMGADIITIMNSMGFLIGLAVTGLTTYTATLTRHTEYGMLKALGAKNIHLYWVVILQAGLSMVLGMGLAIGLTLMLSYAVPILSPELGLVLRASSLLKVAIAAGAIALISALLPMRQIANLDPAMVFRR